jgi:hydroxypyruvate reductase
MSHSHRQLREDVLAIWNAGVNGVRADHLIRNAVKIDGSVLRIGDKRFPLGSIDRIVILGGGKASGAMAESLENILLTYGEAHSHEPGVMPPVIGWINVPSDCAKPLRKIHLHPARPMGVNEPTEAAVAGTREILCLADSLTDRDLCICLISGGGSALLVAPASGITLPEKIAMTRKMSADGATIQELNAARKKVSLIKGGKLAERCRGKRLISLILSDVLGDPLDVIASGPTVEAKPDPLHTNIIIGNLAIAVESAAKEARQRGYSVTTQVATKPEGTAEEVGVELADWTRRNKPFDCLISGGEPVVKLASAEKRGRGGRNQQLVLAALLRLMEDGNLKRSVILSGGTDGEDGPTDAAGAWIDPIFLENFQQRIKDFQPKDYLERNDAYSFFEQFGTLLKTGVTGTNVCDLRVVISFS